MVNGKWQPSAKKSRCYCGRKEYRSLFPKASAASFKKFKKWHAAKVAMEDADVAGVARSFRAATAVLGYYGTPDGMRSLNPAFVSGDSPEFAKMLAGYKERAVDYNQMQLALCTLKDLQKKYRKK
jgi:hypothetical protein